MTLSNLNDSSAPFIDLRSTASNHTLTSACAVAAHSILHKLHEEGAAAPKVVTTPQGEVLLHYIDPERDSVLCATVQTDGTVRAVYRIFSSDSEEAVVRRVESEDVDVVVSFIYAELFSGQ